MITILIVLLWRRLRRHLLLLVLVCVTLPALAQERLLQYTVTRGGTTVGLLVLRETRSANEVLYRLQSSVKSSFVFSVTVRSQEAAVYKDGVLTYLRFHQLLNRSERVNTEIRASGGGYVLVSADESTPFRHAPITFSQICLYTQEPLHRSHLFADKFKKLIPIELVAPHHYRIRFPDGGTNDYYYADGLCVRATINTTWFSAEMQLKN